MKSYTIKLLMLMIVSIFIVTVINAQEKTNIIEITERPIDCNSYLLKEKADLNRAEHRPGDNPAISVERYLKSFLEQCLKSPYRQQVEEDLKAVSEENAERQLIIAKYYLKTFEESQKGLKGASARLKEITEKYSHYSKMDEVLFLLIKVNLIEKDFDEARQNYRRILNEFYLSPYICEANMLIRQAK